LAVAWEVVVVVLGSVIVAVTPWLGVAPVPLTVKDVTPAVPEVGEMLFLKGAAAVTCISSDCELVRPELSLTVHEAV
jgi:hypothetical protein